MNEIQVFENPDFGSVRTLFIDDIPYWVAADVTHILGYSRTNDAVKRRCQCTLKRRILDNKGREHDTYIIPESDLYRLIVHSKLPSAKAFEKWVFEEVLPQIRQTGGYRRDGESSGDGEIRAELDAMRKEIESIKTALKNTPQLPAPKQTNSEIAEIALYKAYVNATLDVCEKLFGMARSQILHICYQSITMSGEDLEKIKREHMERHGLYTCSTIDAVIGHPRAFYLLVECLHDNMAERLNTIAEKMRKKSE